MSAFDDEFGLFSEETEAERGARLPARRIAGPQPERESEPLAPERERRRPHGRRGGRRNGHPQQRHVEKDPWAAPRRATELLDFLARRLVSKPDIVATELFLDEYGETVIELIVDHEDLGKVIGKNGRVAHALRTLVRTTAESPISVDILDNEEASDSD
jgi:predicted RNA-binding protein YlqC (UPF0109 family)